MARYYVTERGWQRLQRRNHRVLGLTTAAMVMWAAFTAYDLSALTITVLTITAVCTLYMAWLVTSMRRSRDRALEAYAAAVDRGDLDAAAVPPSTPRPAVDDPS